jgi:hypothetical protein
MKYGVRISKRVAAGGLQDPPPVQTENTARQCEREIANAVKSWIAELAERKGANKHSILFRSGVQSCVIHR